jgi:hypothetical protein
MLVAMLKLWEGCDTLGWFVKVKLLCRGGRKSHHPLGSERVTGFAILCISIYKQFELIG